MRRSGLHSLCLTVVAAALCGLAACRTAIAQQRVGVSSAVNPESLGTAPGATARPIVIGQTVVFNERITTAARGQAQLLFVDESSMTIGPNSDLTIDQFVYDPKTGTGRLAMSATRGLLRYVGGALSKHEGAVTLRTNTATLAVRGGAFIVDITAGGTTDVIFIYGRSLTVAGVNGALQTLTRPGYQITITPTGGVSSPQRATAVLLSTLTTQLDGQPGASGGAKTVPTDATVDQKTQPLSNTLSQSLNNIVNNTLGAGNINVSNFQQNYIITGALLPSFSTTSITYSGQVKGTANRSVGFAALGPPGSATDINGTVSYAMGTLRFPSGTPQSGAFSGTFGNFGAISFPLPLCSSASSGGCTARFGPAGTSSPFGTFSGTTFMSADDGFFYATITPTSNPAAQLFVFGGAPVDPGFYAPTGNTRIFAFTVQPDSALQSNIPFLRGQAGGNLRNAAVSPFYIVAPPTTPIGDTSTLAAAHGLQASLAINGQGANQQSAIAVTTGIVSTGSNGQPVFNGALRGSSLISASGTPTSVQGSVASTVDGNGVSLYGGTAISGVVLSQSASGVAEVSLSGSSTSYGFAQPALSTNVPAGVGASRTTQALNGYFGGLMYTNAQATPYAVVGDALISTDAPNNRVQATFAGSADASSSGGVSALTLQYGGGLARSPVGHSAFVDDNDFAAIESVADPQSITINGTTSQPTGQLYLVSSGATTAQPANPATGQAAANPADALLPPGTSYCQCQYLQWGYWGGTLTTSDADPPRIDAGHINTWVAGSMTPLADLQTLETQGITARYTGAAIGSVFNNGASYLAAGGFNGTYNFGMQSGSFAITNFDGHNFAASGSAPLTGASYSFGATANGFAGTVNGSFFGPKAAETGGNFAFQSIAGPTYIASGIFAGKQ